MNSSGLEREPSGQSTPDGVSFRHGEQLRALAMASVRIASAPSPAATLQEITIQARTIVGAHLAATHSVSQQGWHGANVAVSVSEKHERFASFAIPPDGSGIYRAVVDDKRPLRISGADLTAHRGWRGLGGYKGEHPPLRGLLAVPITTTDGNSVGVIMLSDKHEGEFTPEDEAILMQLAQVASVCIQNSVANEALRKSEQRLRATQEHANIAIGEVDAKGRFTSINAGFSRVTGYTRDELLKLTFFDLTHPDDVLTEREKYAQQVAGALDTYSLEKRYIRKDGSAGWVAVSASAVFDENKRFLYGVRVLEDIDERKRTDERQKLLIRELHHRVRNTLATVQGLLGGSARAASSISEFYDAFSGRIAALGQTHTLLTEDYWQTATLADMLHNELTLFNDGAGQRISFEGPRVDLAADLAVPLGMALHELATNALKHGALSNETGRITISWGIVEDDVRKLRLEWHETGGPPVRQPTQKGFGSTLLTRVLTAQCDADVKFDYDPEGLRIHLVAPLVQRRLVPPY